MMTKHRGEKFMAATIDTTEFDRLQRYILERVGIQLNDNQTNDLRRTIATQLGSYRNIDHLQLALSRESLDAPVWQDILRVITIGETYFFRNQDQFNALRTSVLPSIIEKHREAGNKQIRMWSAGCATGGVFLRRKVPAGVSRFREICHGHSAY